MRAARRTVELRLLLPIILLVPLGFVVTNIAVDLTAPTTPLADDAPFHLCCAPAAASERLQRLRDLGFDDAVLLVKTPTEANLVAARALLR